MKANIKQWWQRYRAYVWRSGLPLVFLGVLLMALAMATGWSHYNGVMTTAFLLILVGIVVYVVGERKAGRY